MPARVASGVGEFRPSAQPTVPCPQYWRGPIRFPGCVPNSVVLQQMWLPEEVSGLGALGGLSGSPIC